MNPSNRVRWNIVAISCLLASATMAACGDPSGPGIQVTAGRDSLEVALGESQQLTATVTGTPARWVTWRSNAPDIARVSSSGLVTGVRRGTATIVAMSVGDTTRTASVAITVGVPPTMLRIPPVNFRPTILGQLLPGDTMIARAVGFVQVQTYKYYTPSSEGVLQRVAWESRNPEVATIDSAGRVTAHAPGIARLVATSVSAPNLSDSAQVLVIPTGRTFEQVIAGSTGACALTADERAYCWNASGSNIGDGTFENRIGPFEVAGGLRFQALSMGADLLNFGTTTCGLADGTAYCWGLNASGMLGDGTRSSRMVPTRVATELRFTEIDVGAAQACGLVDSGDVYCWGRHWTAGFTTLYDALTPAMAAAGMRFTSLAIGYEACALDASGTAYCWMVGGGRTPARVDTDLRFTMLAAGTGFACGITEAGTAHCWGQGTHGQLGNGTVSTDKVTVPVAVSGGLRFTTISARDATACGLATDQRAWCWGWNGYGALGDGTLTDRSVPTLVGNGRRFTSIDVGTPTCGMSEGKAYCWARNDYGEAGVNGAAPTLVPTRVATQR